MTDATAENETPTENPTARAIRLIREDERARILAALPGWLMRSGWVRGPRMEAVAEAEVEGFAEEFAAAIAAELPE